MLLQWFILGVNLHFQMYSERSATLGRIKNTLHTILKNCFFSCLFPCGNIKKMNILVFHMLEYFCEPCE